MQKSLIVLLAVVAVAVGCSGNAEEPTAAAGAPASTGVAAPANKAAAQSGGGAAAPGAMAKPDWAK